MKKLPDDEQDYENMMEMYFTLLDAIEDGTVETTPEFKKLMAKTLRLSEKWCEAELDLCAIGGLKKSFDNIQKGARKIECLKCLQRVEVNDVGTFNTIEGIPYTVRECPVCSISYNYFIYSSNADRLPEEKYQKALREIISPDKESVVIGTNSNKKIKPKGTAYIQIYEPVLSAEATALQKKTKAALHKKIKEINPLLQKYLFGIINKN